MAGNELATCVCVNDGHWHHLVVVWTGKTVKDKQGQEQPGQLLVYLNNSLVHQGVGRTTGALASKDIPTTALPPKVSVGGRVYIFSPRVCFVYLCRRVLFLCGCCGCCLLHVDECVPRGFVSDLFLSPREYFVTSVTGGAYKTHNSFSQYLQNAQLILSVSRHLLNSTSPRSSSPRDTLASAPPITTAGTPTLATPTPG